MVAQDDVSTEQNGKSEMTVAQRRAELRAAKAGKPAARWATEQCAADGRSIPPITNRGDRPHEKQISVIQSEKHRLGDPKNLNREAFAQRDAVLVASDFTVSFLDRKGKTFSPFRDLDLHVRAGEFLCILGPSGGGKTTLLNSFGGFLTPTKGSVLYNGRELVEPTAEIVMIFQENNLYPWLTVEGNIGFGPRMNGVPRQEVKKRCERLLKKRWGFGTLGGVIRTSFPEGCVNEQRSRARW